ncbi:MAG TPA: serine/threonine-protein kinase [Planctomycetota bacterium]|nr:serine/threonine-protein kinase [Planctomycetota bacterium]
MPALGSYDVEAELGRGAFGRVWRARHRPTGALRALKVVDGIPDQGTFARFQREAEVLARVGGEGVVPVHEAGVEQGRHFFVMGLMPGGSLRTRLRDRGRFEWREAAGVVLALARALARCHAAGIVHRDVKPENVLFDDEDRPRLADFGLVRDLHATTLTESGVVVGTPTYMAPEQLDGARVDARADVYALGVLLHELVAGAPPFQKEASTFALLREKQSGKRPRVGHGAPAALDDLIDHALAPKPDARTRGAAELARELEAVLAGKPLMPGSRSPALAWAALAILAVLGVTGWLARGSTHTRQDVAPTLPVTSRGPRWSDEKCQRIQNDASHRVVTALEAVAAAGSECPDAWRAAIVASATKAVEVEAERLDATRSRAGDFSRLALFWRGIAKLEPTARSEPLADRVRAWISEVSITQPFLRQEDAPARVEQATRWVSIVELAPPDLDPEHQGRLLAGTKKAVEGCLREDGAMAPVLELARRFGEAAPDASEAILTLSVAFQVTHDTARRNHALEEAIAHASKANLADVLDELGDYMRLGILGPEEWSHTLGALARTKVSSDDVGHAFTSAGLRALDAADPWTCQQNFLAGEAHLRASEVPWDELLRTLANHGDRERWRSLLATRSSRARDLVLLVSGKIACALSLQRRWRFPNEPTYFLRAAWLTDESMRKRVIALGADAASKPSDEARWAFLSAALSDLIVELLGAS